MDDPLVSIVVSSYNRPRMLATALSSVIQQTYKNLEIIVQDDSTDLRCFDLVVAIKDPRVRFFRNSPPLGTCANLRDGYRKCSGIYIATLNDDDFCCKEYVSVLVKALEDNRSCSVAFSDHYVVDESGRIDNDLTAQTSKIYGRDRLVEGIVLAPLRQALVIKSVPGMFALFRREDIDLCDFPEEVSAGYDYWLTYLAVRNGRNLYFYRDKLTFYRRHAGSQTSCFSDPENRLRFLSYQKFILQRFLADERLISIRRDIEARLSSDCFSSGVTLLRLLDRRGALDQFIQSLKAKFNVRATFGLALCILPDCLLRLL